MSILSDIWRLFRHLFVSVAKHIYWSIAINKLLCSLACSRQHVCSSVTFFVHFIYIYFSYIFLSFSYFFHFLFFIISIFLSFSSSDQDNLNQCVKKNFREKWNPIFRLWSSGRQFIRASRNFRISANSFRIWRIKIFHLLW